MEFYEIIASDPVGTGFIPSGDSSPGGISTTLPPGFISMHGDESPDAINGVPTMKNAILYVKVLHRVH